RTVEGEWTDAGPDQGCNQAPASERLAQVAGDGSDVGSSATRDLQLQVRPAVVHQVGPVDPHEPGLEIDHPAGTRQIISALALDLERRVLWRTLQDLANLAGESLPDLQLAGDAGVLHHRHPALGIEGVAAGTQANDRPVNLGHTLDRLDQPCGRAYTDDQNPG